MRGGGALLDLHNNKELLIKCNICDKEITDKEIVYNDDLPGFEPCPPCLTIIMDAAYTQEFVYDEEHQVLDEEFDIDEDSLPRCYRSEEGYD